VNVGVVAAGSLVTNVNGASYSSNNTRLDGAMNVNTFLVHNALYIPPAESIETVNIATNSLDADQGIAGGAAVNVMTKSGSNQFHGAAFGYHSNSRLAAENFFYIEKNLPKNLINQYGGTLGGPIKKDSLFFFGSWEGLRQRQNFSRLLTVPTADQRAGDFSAFNTRIYDPTTGLLDGAGRTAFENAMIPASRQSAITRKFANLIPLPNLPGVSSNYFASAPLVLNQDNVDGKINWNRSPKNSLWAKYSTMRQYAVTQTTLGEAGGDSLGGAAGIIDATVQLATIGSTYVVSPNFLFDATLGFTRQGLQSIPPDYGRDYQLGIPGTLGPDIRQSGLVDMRVSGYPAMGNVSADKPSFKYENTWALATNANWIHGSHDIRFGLDLARQQMNHWQPEAGLFRPGPRGKFSFTGGATALRAGAAPNQFNGWADWVLGLPQQAGKSLQFYDPMSTREWQTGLYFRDRWHAQRNLTITLGLRWEYYPLMTRAHSGIERYDVEANKVFLGRFGAVPDNAGTTVSKKLFAPRIGVAYRIGPKVVVRTGYGISIDPYPVARAMRAPYPVVVVGDYLGPKFVPAISPHRARDSRGRRSGYQQWCD